MGQKGQICFFQSLNAGRPGLHIDQGHFSEAIARFKYGKFVIFFFLVFLQHPDASRNNNEKLRTDFTFRADHRGNGYGPRVHTGSQRSDFVQVKIIEKPDLRQSSNQSVFHENSFGYSSESDSRKFKLRFGKIFTSIIKFLDL